MNRKPILDNNGENKALSCFLDAYSNSIRKEIETIKSHMESNGYPYWPSWVNESKKHSFMTSTQVQDWIKYLIKLEDIKETPPGVRDW